MEIEQVPPRVVSPPTIFGGTMLTFMDFALIALIIWGMMTFSSKREETNVPQV